MKYFYKNILSFIFLPLVAIVIFISYNRFFLKQDYIITYEGSCDPFIEECFVGCEDDACDEKYFYTKIIKYAPDLYNNCGDDITNCESANICLPEDEKCSITYCNSETTDNIDDCENFLKEEAASSNLELNINI